MIDTLQIMKQGANSMVRFSSFNALQDVALRFKPARTQKLGSSEIFVVGAGAGLITVCECVEVASSME